MHGNSTDSVVHTTSNILIVILIKVSLGERKKCKQEHTIK